ncbi:hypothetical protein Nepgr_027261 [Nepenthes gracilis]|uniref:Uncharacterized protein n=1 Tax=Nepenthes gracilis TaxID=150966 RepID=A0AAD3TA21_NEPGR|nr:hypothetical protein Nepgr_027261 [Nepenthes gracilis]
MDMEFSTSSSADSSVHSSEVPIVRYFHLSNQMLNQSKYLQKLALKNVSTSFNTVIAWHQEQRPSASAVSLNYHYYSAVIQTKISTERLYNISCLCNSWASVIHPASGEELHNIYHKNIPQNKE